MWSTVDGLHISSLKKSRPLRLRLEVEHEHRPHPTSPSATCNLGFLFTSSKVAKFCRWPTALSLPWDVLQKGSLLSLMWIFHLIMLMPMASRACMLPSNWSRIRIVVVDLGSSNGTYLNGVRLSPHIETPVAHGDLIYLGKLKMQVLID